MNLELGPGAQDQPRAAWGAVPVRAIADRRMSATHFRVLAAIAMHDRLSVERGKGAGCWASNKTLAAETGVNYTNLSTAITELGVWGYIERGHHPLNKRQHVYRVIYDPLPQGEPLPLPIGKTSDQGGCSTQLQEKSDTLPSGEQSSTAVCPGKIITPDNQGDRPQQYIPLKREDIPLKRERDSAEAAPFKPRPLKPINVGGSLAAIERHLQEGGALGIHFTAFLHKVIDSHDEGESSYQRAQRILETWAT